MHFTITPFILDDTRSALSVSLKNLSNFHNVSYLFVTGVLPNYYSNFVYISFYRNRSRYTGGGTRTDRAIEKADRELFERDRPDKPDVLIVMTDGKTNRGSKKYSDVLKPLHVSTGYTIDLFFLFITLPH